MKKSRFSVLGAAILSGLLLPAFPISGDSPTIISNWDASIQLIDTRLFLEWPGVNERIPVDVSAEDGRIWLVWPDALVSLDADADSDARSLLALFASTVNHGTAESWSAEAGLVCADGVWRSVDPSTGDLVETDLFSGDVRRRPLEGIGTAVIHGAPGGDLVTVGPDGARHIVSGVREPAAPLIRMLETDLPLMSQAAVSREAPLAAWMVPGNRMIRVIELPLPQPGEATLPGDAAPVDIRMESPVWMMDWAGHLLVLAGPGRLTAFDPSGSRWIEGFVLEDPRLPRRWYRIRGGSGRLLIHSPETGLVAVVSTNTKIPEGNGRLDFPSILESHALEAGRLLEDAGLNGRAVAYYTWVLTHVRRQRSRMPLEETWPALERDISDRRALLSGGW